MMLGSLHLMCHDDRGAFSERIPIGIESVNPLCYSSTSFSQISAPDHGSMSFILHSFSFKSSQSFSVLPASNVPHPPSTGAMGVPPMAPVALCFGFVAWLSFLHTAANLGCRCFVSAGVALRASLLHRSASIQGVSSRSGFAGSHKTMCRALSRAISRQVSSCRHSHARSLGLDEVVLRTFLKYLCWGGRFSG
jgi:hypothetical protein